MTDEIELKVLEAFSAIHALGVTHNDVRGDNILIAEGGTRVWIIDFERSGLLADCARYYGGQTESVISNEIETVKQLFSAIKCGKERW